MELEMVFDFCWRRIEALNFAEDGEMDLSVFCEIEKGK